jgi:hypothetical protein
MPPYRQREWLSQSEYRKRKRVKEKMRLEYEKQRELERLKEYEEGKAAREARYEKANSVNSKLWAWGVDSEKHPTHSMGLFATIIMYLFVVPVMGFLYKLSFTLVVPVLFVGVGFIAILFRKMKS